MQPLLSITDQAAARALHLMQQSSEPVEGLRIGITNTGCSGMSYKVEYATEKKKLEEMVEDKGVKIFIEPTAIMFLIGAIIDYKEDRFSSGFTFENPNAKAVCGCGESFAV